MKRSLPAKIAGVALVFVLAQCAHERAQRDEEEGDDATGRRDAMAEWYGESQVASREGFAADYRRFLLEAAAKEKERWAELLPDVNTRPSAAIGYYWQNLGPTKADYVKNGSTTLSVTDSGRLRSIVIDPANGKKIYLATAAGGVWTTDDGGGSWTPITESLGTLSCGSLAMDPKHSSVLYLGLGDPYDGWGAGIVKSVNGGTTWSAPQFLGASTVTAQVVVSRGDGNVVLAATNAGLYRSADAGASWAPVSLATGQAATVLPYVWSIAQTGDHGFALSLEANHANLMGTTDGQVWTSADDGATWTRAAGFEKTTGVGRATLAAAPSNPQILYAEAAVPNPKSGADLADLYKSSDGGKTWTALNVTAKTYAGPTDQTNVGSLLNGQGWYDQLVIVDPKKPDTVYFGGALALARTTDGGTTFTQLSQWLGRNGLPYVHADFHTGAFDPTGKLYIGSDGGLFRSTDAGKTWSADLNRGLVTHLLYSIGSSTKDPSVIIGGMQDNGTRMRDGTSKTFNQVIGGDGFGSDVNDSDPKQVLGSLYYGQILKSSDGGKTWNDGCSGIDECGDSSNAPFITRIVRWTGTKDGVPQGNIVYTFMNKVVYRSEDYADSWTKLGTTGLPADLFIRGIGIAESSEKTVGIVGNGGRIFLSNDGGATWTQAATPANSNKSMSDVRFDDADPTKVVLASVAPDAKAGHLWRSADFGKTWTPLDGDGSGFPAGVPVNLIKADPSDGTVLYAGTELGVYRSQDGGTTWKRFGWGLPLVNVTDLYISADSKLVRVATFGRGFFELTPFRPRDPI